MVFDPATEYLSRIHATLRDSGLIGYIHIAVGLTWRANLERHDPEHLFDDQRTLGFQSAANLSNRAFEELRGTSGLLAPRVTAVIEAQATVVHVDGYHVRFVKLPANAMHTASGPYRLRWDGREGRANAAQRNSSNYTAPKTVLGHEPFFELPQPDAAERLVECKDVFIAWGGRNDGRTNGWVGLPSAVPQPWLALEAAWVDDDGAAHVVARTSPAVPSFSGIETPLPTIRLKNRPADGAASV